MDSRLGLGRTRNTTSTPKLNLCAPKFVVEESGSFNVKTDVAQQHERRGAVTVAVTVRVGGRISRRVSPLVSVVSKYSDYTHMIKYPEGAYHRL